mmetsp:Transcript_3158/g.5166  ORF Transcript_3158/g.5166 Transcript_3158/m.5166 type:complete len:99 (+) Transcript_3158:77-373(+)
MSGAADGCAYFCMLTSGVGIPLLMFFGYLCITGSPMMEVPEASKPDAGKGCIMAAILYALTFAGCYMYTCRKQVDAREVPLNHEVQMQDASTFRSAAR